MEKKRLKILLPYADPPEPTQEEQLPVLLESILEEMEIPEALREMAAEAVPRRFEENGQWYLDYKGWRVIFGAEPLEAWKNAWVRIIDEGHVRNYEWNGSDYDYVSRSLDESATLNAEGRTLCQCGKFGICHAVRLVRRR